MRKSGKKSAYTNSKIYSFLLIFLYFHHFGFKNVNCFQAFNLGWKNSNSNLVGKKQTHIMQEFYYHLIYYLYFRSCCPIRIIMLGGRNYLDQKIYWGVDLGLLNAYLVLTPRTIWLKKFWISFNFEQTNSTNEATIFTVLEV